MTLDAKPAPRMIHTVLIANRGEVAIRIGRACAALGLRSVAVFATDDAASLHVRRADASHALPGRGEAAYLDVAAIIHAARQTGCDAVHPGDGCLSEDAAFARACEAAGLIFVGSSPDLLALFTDRMRTRQLAAECNVATPGGSDGAVGLAEAADVLDSLGPARHVGIQIIADGQGGVTQVGERIARFSGAIAPSSRSRRARVSSPWSVPAWRRRPSPWHAASNCAGCARSNSC